MSTGQSSQQYGAAMGSGWRDGLRFKFGHKINKIALETTIFKSPPNQKDPLGDIDVLILTNQNMNVYDLFPASIIVRPVGHATFETRTIFSEVKHSVTNKNVREKIQQFVRFYDKLFRDECIYMPLLSRTTRKSRGDESALLLFVFNGADCVRVESTMNNIIRDVCGNMDMKIHGRHVVCVWVDSTSLIPWRDKQEGEQRLAEREAEIAAQAAELAAKDREIARLQKLLGSKRKRGHS